MNSEAEAAELILRIVFGGTAYFLKAMPSMVVGGIEGCKAFGGMIQNAVNKHRTKGSSKLEYIIRQEKGMSVFTLPEKEMYLFKEAASKIKKHPYVALESVEQADTPDRMVTIICTGDDAPLFNAIIKQNRLHGNMAADFEHQRTEKVAEKPEPAKEPISKEAVEQAEQQKAAKEDTAKKNEEFINAVEGKGRGEKKTENPTPAAEETTENAPPSENASQSFKGSIGIKEEVDIEHLHSEVQKDVDIEHLPSAIEIEGKQPEQVQEETVVLDSSFDIRNSSREAKVDSPVSAASESPDEQPADVEQAVVTEVLDVDTKREPGQWPDERHYDFLRRQARKEEKYDVAPDRIIDVEPEELKPVVPPESKESEQSEPRSHARPSVRQRLKEVTEKLKKQQADPTPEVDRNQTIDIIINKLQEHSDADVPAK